MWNHRVMIDVYEYADGYKESTATIHEVYYGNGNTDRFGIGHSGAIEPVGTGENDREALESLKLELQLMLESVEYALQNKTTVYDYNKPETHNPGEPSAVMREYEAKNRPLDQDDAYMDEKYGDDE